MSRKSNRNAIKHGIFSRMVIAPNEDPKEFWMLLQTLREEWDPQGLLQEDRVMNLAKNLWRKRRISNFRGECARFLGLQVRGKEVEDIDSLEKFLDDVRAGKPISELTMPPPGWADIPRRYKESDDDWLKRVTRVFSEVRKELISTRGEMANSVVKMVISDEGEISRELALEERIDAKIDKDIMSLGRMKTMQAMGLGRRPSSGTSEQATAKSLKRIDSPSIDAEESTEDR